MFLNASRDKLWVTGIGVLIVPSSVSVKGLASIMRFARWIKRTTRLAVHMNKP